jgi:hypothetical protein
MSGGLVPPSDLDAEAVALAVCLLYPEEIDKVSSIVKPSDFYADSNGRTNAPISCRSLVTFVIVERC